MTIGELATQLVPFVSVKRPNYRDLTVLIQVGTEQPRWIRLKEVLGAVEVFPKCTPGAANRKPTSQT